jgi:hypothetical protein
VDEERLRRLDEHMDRGNAIMEHSNEIMQRSNEVMIRNEVAFRDLRDFLAEHTLAVRAMTAEFTAEMRAQREALFRILDRLDRNGGETGGAA